MNPVNDFRTLVRLFAEGGIEISTPERGIGDGNSTNSNNLLVLTLIQPDADVITYVSGKALSQPETLRRHLRKIEKQIRSIRRFRNILAKIWLLSPLLLASGVYRFGIRRIQWVAITLAISATPLILKPFLRCYLQSRIRKEIQRICKG